MKDEKAKLWKKSWGKIGWGYEYCVDVANKVSKMIEAGADVNISNENNMTALMLASGFGYVDAVQALINAKADVNAQNIDGRTALILAVACNRKPVVEKLLENGAFVNARDLSGSTALMYAAENSCITGNEEIFKLLLDHDADIFAENDFGANVWYSTLPGSAARRLLKEACIASKLPRKVDKHKDTDQNKGNSKTR